MSTSEAASLEKLIRECDLDWMIDWYAPQTEAIDFWLRFLAEVNLEFRRRFGDSAPQLCVGALATEYGRNPLKIAAFLQAMSGMGSPQLLVMVWRITIQGLEIESVQMDYYARTSFSLRVKLRSPALPDPEIYESDDIADAKLIRHFGTLKSQGRPLFSGFYPLRL
jgi:hypothetical protein